MTTSTFEAKQDVETPTPTEDNIIKPPPEFEATTPPDNIITVEFKKQPSAKESVTQTPVSRTSSNELDSKQPPSPSTSSSISVTSNSSSVRGTDSTTSSSNTSLITINSDVARSPINTPLNVILPNSLAANVSQITVVTSTHPPVIIDNSAPPATQQSEVVIVSNELNKTTHVNESSTDEDYPSLDDSLDYTSSPRKQSSMIVTINERGEEVTDRALSKNPNNRQRLPAGTTTTATPRKLDESEVLIVSPSFVDEDSAYNTASVEHDNDDRLLDTSHVSVVTVGEEIKVKDSSHMRTMDSNSDISSVGGGATLSECSDEFGSKQSSAPKINNGQLSPMESHEDVNIIINRKKTHPSVVLPGVGSEKRVSPDNSVGSVDSQGHSESGSVRSIGGFPLRGVMGVKITTGDRSDAESVATTTSHDSRNEPETNSTATAAADDEVVIRHKHVPLIPKSVTTVPGPTKEEIELRNLRKKTRKRTRKFEIDGVQVTTTTSRVIYGDEETGRLYDDHALRKQELRELKMLQKQEKKQQNDLQLKEQMAKEQQDRRFEQERISLEKTYEADMDTLTRQQKQLIEKTEQTQEHELRSSSKRIRSEQEQELKIFRENLKQEIRLLKQEIDLLPKEKRKDEFKKRRAAMELDHEEKERAFLDSLKERHEMLLRRLSEKHRDHLATINRNFLQQKQNAMRTREALLWELEEKQLHERHQLAKRHVKEICFMQRHQMIVRHEKELDQVKRMLQRKEEDLLKKQTLEKRALPKRIRAERKARDLMFRESLRISTNLDPEVERERVKKVNHYLSTFN